MTKTKQASVPSPGVRAARTKRLPEADRRAQIIREATRLFAEEGFTANTRELAVRLGTTQPLLYRYFPSKEALIDAVLQHLFNEQKEHGWEKRLRDRTVPLRDRLKAFAYAYASGTYDHNWIRIYMYAGLAGGGFNRRYIAAITEPILQIIAREIKYDLNPTAGRSTIGRTELDYLWVFHGGLYYHSIRQNIYGLSIPEDRLREIVELSVDTMIFGMSKILANNSSV